MNFPRTFTKGNLVNWDDSVWDLDDGNKWIELTKEDLCLLPKPRDIVFPEKRTFADSTLLCRKLKGQLTITDSLAKQEALIAEFMRVIEQNQLNQWHFGK